MNDEKTMSLPTWFDNYFINFARSIVRHRRLQLTSPLSVRFQREIIRAYRRLGRPMPKDQIDLLGYKIHFMGESYFRWLFDEIFMDASYFFRASHDRPLIFDCGSNIGMSVLFFKKLYPDARIVAFEPDPTTFDTLRRNIEQNHLSDVSLHQIALGNRASEIELFRDASPRSSSLMMSTLRRRHNGPSVKVPAQCLSEFISSEIDFLKIDVEGAEEEIMSDLANTGKLRFVVRLHLEYHHHIDPSVDELSRMLRLLEENGFGYQLRGNTYSRWPEEGLFQDISIYGYRK